MYLKNPYWADSGNPKIQLRLSFRWSSLKKKGHRLQKIIRNLRFSNYDKNRIEILHQFFRETDLLTIFLKKLQFISVSGFEIVFPSN